MKHVDNSKKKKNPQNKQRHTNAKTKNIEHNNTDSMNHEMSHMHSNVHTRKHMHQKNKQTCIH